MTLHGNRRGGRGGFTLIEILIVIVIIAILASLVAVVASRAFGKANQAASRVEIGQLEASIAAFKNQYNVPYIPSRLWLDESGQWTANTTVPVKSAVPTASLNLPQLEADSRQWLERVFGRSLTFPIDWNGNGTAGPTDPNSNMILEGHQVIVFALGGLGGTNGFSTSPTNPANFAGGVGKKGPFFEFDPGRLKQAPGDPVAMPGYLDRYGSNFYAYLSAYKSQNGYNPYGVSDCTLLGVDPYFDQYNFVASPPTITPTRFLKPNDFQIICAGPDGKFGALKARLLLLPPNPGANTAWTPQNAGNVWPSGTVGVDDLSNFYDGALGSAQ